MDKALKLYNTLVQKYHLVNASFWLQNQPSLVRKSNTTNTTSQSVSYTQVTSSANIFENNSQNEHVYAQSIDFQKTFDLIIQIEKIVEPNRAKISELSVIENLKKNFHGYPAFYFSCASLQLSLKTMQHSSDELQSAVTLLKDIHTNNFHSNYDTENF